MSERSDDIRRFICVELLMDPDRPLGDEDDLLMSGLVDSLGVMRLVYFIEEQFGTRVPFTDITIENFNSIRSLDQYLANQS